MSKITHIGDMSVRIGIEIVTQHNYIPLGEVCFGYFYKDYNLKILSSDYIVAIWKIKWKQL